jgi:hypothetical protein
LNSRCGCEFSAREAPRSSLTHIKHVMLLVVTATVGVASSQCRFEIARGVVEGGDFISNSLCRLAIPNAVCLFQTLNLMNWLLIELYRIYSELVATVSSFGLFVTILKERQQWASGGVLCRGGGLEFRRCPEAADR